MRTSYLDAPSSRRRTPSFLSCRRRAEWEKKREEDVKALEEEEEEEERKNCDGDERGRPTDRDRRPRLCRQRHLLQQPSCPDRTAVLVGK